MKTIALTGATSMTGIALIKECIRNDVSVVAFIRSNSAKINRIPKSDLVTVFECNNEIINDFDISDCIKHFPEVFYHFAWGYTDKQFGLNSSNDQIRNIQFTLDAVNLAKRMGCRKFIGAGSQSEYGRSLNPLTCTTPIEPEIAYGIAKYAAGKFAKIECEKQNIEYIWVRVLSVYGIHDNEDTLIKTFISNCKNNYPMALGPCTNIWDYLYEDDAGRALLAIGKRGQNGKVYCLGSGVGRPLKEYLETIRNIVNPAYIPKYGEIPYGEKSVKYLCADISDLTRDTGWKPEIPFEEGIRRIITRSTA
jgi:nucleoside-diphosphate-sugar epimerase